MKLGISEAWDLLVAGDAEGALKALFAGFESIESFFDKVINYLRDILEVPAA